MLAESEAIILKSKKYGDTSKIVTLYAKHHGITTLIAKGAREQKSHFGGSLEPLCNSYVSYYRKPGRELHLLSKAETVQSNKKIFESYQHTAYGLMIAESVLESQTEQEPNDILFQGISYHLSELAKLQQNSFALFASFQLLLAGQIGIGMNFDESSVSEELFYGKDISYSIESGCPMKMSGGIANHSFRLKSSAFRFLNCIVNNDLEKLSDTNTDFKSQSHIKDFFTYYFSFHLEKKFVYKSFNLLKI
ncbi:MAG: repair protein RecO [Bacteroidota bacterium]|nr:repair protein RecO [Bacteroidota bacterium]